MLEAVVEGMQGKLNVVKLEVLEVLAAIYNPESLRALENYHPPPFPRY